MGLWVAVWIWQGAFLAFPLSSSGKANMQSSAVRTSTLGHGVRMSAMVIGALNSLLGLFKALIYPLPKRPLMLAFLRDRSPRPDQPRFTTSRNM